MPVLPTVALINFDAQSNLLWLGFYVVVICKTAPLALRLLQFVASLIPVVHVGIWRQLA